MAGTKKVNEQKIPEKQPKVESNKSTGLIYLGIVVFILGILSATTHLIARTFLSAPTDFMVFIGLIAIVVGLITKGRQ